MGGHVRTGGRPCPPGRVPSANGSSSTSRAATRSAGSATRRPRSSLPGPSTSSGASAARRRPGAGSDGLMESRAKLFGHPVHPMLIVVPLGLFSIGVLFDVVYVLTGATAFAEVAFWNIGAGVAGGLLAAIFGLADWLLIP